VIPAIARYEVLSADLVTSSASPVDTGLSIQIPANQLCQISGYFPCATGAGASGIGFLFSVDQPIASVSAVGRLFALLGLAANATIRAARFTAFPADFANTVLVMQRDNFARFDFTVMGGAAASVLRMGFYRSAGAGNVSLFAGGYFSQILIS